MFSHLLSLLVISARVVELVDEQMDGRRRSDGVREMEVKRLVVSVLSAGGSPLWINDAVTKQINQCSL